MLQTKEEMEECISMQIRLSQGHQKIIDKHTELLDRQTTIMESLYHRLKLLAVVVVLTWLFIILTVVSFLLEM